MTIRPPAAADRPQWQRLWEEYLHFYQHEPDPVSTGHLWARLLDDEDLVEGLIAESEGGLVGIVHFFPHPSTWQPKPVCYLQDLYVDSVERGQGVGRLLIQEVVERAREAGWSHVYWQTAEDNTRARRLYDQLTGASTGFIVYQLPVSKIGNPEGTRLVGGGPEVVE